MDLKIFKFGAFTIEDYNKFCDENMTFNQQVLQNGDIYVFYKPATDVGSRVIDQIVTLDKLAQAAQVEIITAEAEDRENTVKIPKLKEKLSPLSPNSKEYKDLDEEIKGYERRGLLNSDTIQDRKAKIVALKETAQVMISAHLLAKQVDEDIKK